MNKQKKPRGLIDRYDLDVRLNPRQNTSASSSNLHLGARNFVISKVSIFVTVSKSGRDNDRFLRIMWLILSFNQTVNFDFRTAFIRLALTKYEPTGCEDGHWQLNITDVHAKTLCSPPTAVSNAHESALHQKLMGILPAPRRQTLGHPTKDSRRMNHRTASQSWIQEKGTGVHAFDSSGSPIK